MIDRPAIKFSRKGNNVIAEIYCGRETEKANGVFLFDFQFNFEVVAEVMRAQFQSTMDKAMREIREQAYNQGWKDAKSHKVAKKKEFVEATIVTPVCGY